jgi:hypothetical protein
LQPCDSDGFDLVDGGLASCAGRRTPSDVAGRLYRDHTEDAQHFAFAGVAVADIEGGGEVDEVEHVAEEAGDAVACTAGGVVGEAGGALERAQQLAAKRGGRRG